MSSKPSDEQLKQAINGIFDKYDVDKSGTLEGAEVHNLITDAFKSLGKGKQVTEDDVKNFVQAIDKNSDGKISKD
jgi:Ca2+-binding EF-hand superfamily protein